MRKLARIYHIMALTYQSMMMKYVTEAVRNSSISIMKLFGNKLILLLERIALPNSFKEEFAHKKTFQRNHGI